MIKLTSVYDVLLILFMVSVYTFSYLDVHVSIHNPSYFLFLIPHCMSLSLFSLCYLYMSVWVIWSDEIRRQFY